MGIGDPYAQVLFSDKLIRAYAAQGTFKILGQVFKLGSGGDSGFAVALRFVIDPTANLANILHTAASVLKCTDEQLRFVGSHGTVCCGGDHLTQLLGSDITGGEYAGDIGCRVLPSNNIAVFVQIDTAI